MQIKSVVFFSSVHQWNLKFEIQKTMIKRWKKKSDLEITAMFITLWLCIDECVFWIQSTCITFACIYLEFGNRLMFVWPRRATERHTDLFINGSWFVQQQQSEKKPFPITNLLFRVFPLFRCLCLYLLF